MLLEGLNKFLIKPGSVFLVGDSFSLQLGPRPWSGEIETEPGCGGSKMG